MNQKPVDSEEQTTAGKTVEALAYPLAAATGGMYLHTSVSDNVYDNLKRLDVVNELSVHRDDFKSVQKAARKVTANLPHDMPTPAEKELAARYEKAAESLPKFQERWTKLYKEALEREGFGSFWSRFTKGQHDSQRWNSLAAAATATGVTLGVVLTFANSKVFMKKNPEIDAPAADQKTR